MNYIINPIWFYFLDVAQELEFFSVFIFILDIVAFIIGITIREANHFDGIQNKYFQLGNNLFKISLPFFIASLILTILIPSKETMISMMVAKFATYENAAWTLDTIKSAVDYIVEAIASIK